MHLANIIEQWLYEIGTYIPDNLVVVKHPNASHGFINAHGWSIVFIESDRVHITGFSQSPPEIINSTDPEFFKKLDRGLNDVLCIIRGGLSQHEESIQHTIFKNF